MQNTLAPGQIDAVDCGDLCVHQLIERQAHRTPNRVAVAFQGKELTYGELNGRANQFAHYLRVRNVGPDILVGVFLERSLEMMVAVLGILKAGGAYLPLDPSLPPRRLAFMLTDARIPLLVTSASMAATLPRGLAELIEIDTDWPRISQEDESDPPNQARADSLAYVIYTSGSSGEPKGVMVPHGGLSNYLSWAAKTYPITEGRGSLVHSPIGFDLTITALFLPLLVGKRVVLLPEGSDVEGLCAALIEEGDYSFIKITPSHIEALTRLLPPERASGIARALIIGGEALRADQLTFWSDYARETRVFNEYGPTETVVGCCVYEVVPGTPLPANVPIGRPIDHTQLYVLDAQRKPVAEGAEGEIYIGGKGVARGYLNRPDLTAQSFIPDPFGPDPGARLYKTGDGGRRLPDGDFQFLGRLDQQVKVHGFRIEPGEIEVILNRHPAVRECVVTIQERVHDEKRLAVYWVPRPSMAPTDSELRDYLKGWLPDYMIPSAFRAMDALPLTKNGKIDRRALPPILGRPRLNEPFKAPHDDLETQLKEIWEGILGIDPIGVSDDFFELGGTSLSAVHLLAEVQRVFQLHFPLHVLEEGASIEHLARLIRSPRNDKHDPLLVPLQPEGYRRPFFFVHGIGGNVTGFKALAQHLDADRPFYGLRARGFDGIKRPHASVEEMAADYLEELLSVQPQGPFLLGGYSSGAIVAFEMAQQLHDRGHAVGFLAVIDNEAPRLDNRRQGRARHVLNLIHDLPYWFIDFVVTRSRHEVVADVKRHTRRLFRRLARGPFGTAATRHELSDALDVSRLPENYRRVIEIHYQAVMNYKPRVYSGRITLFRTRAQPLSSSHERDRGWGWLTTEGVEVYMVTGTHNMMIANPRDVQSLASKMRQALDAIDSPVGSRKWRGDVPTQARA
jgi:amino acid adenylation domain-containing protein